MLAKRYLFVDMDAMFVSVEELYDATLRGQLVAVGGRPEERGVVASASYPARAKGIRSAMPMVQAVRLCPDLIIVPPHFDRYQQASREVMAYLQTWSPAFEQCSIDEAVLGIEMIALPEHDLALQVQTTIRETLGLPCSIGIGGGKHLSKMIADAGKRRAAPGAPPSAITIVPPGQDAAFIAGFPIEHLHGVGQATARKMRSRGITTIGELARRPDTLLRQQFGRWGGELGALSRGIDRSVIEASHQRQSVSQEHTFSHDITDLTTLEHTIHRQALAISRQLREAGWQGKTVRLKLRWAPFQTVTRQIALAQPTLDQAIIAQSALNLLYDLWQPGQAVRLLGVGLDQISPLTVQLSLWEPLAADHLAKDAALQATIARLRQRFGDQAIAWGNETRDHHESSRRPEHQD